MTKTSIINWNIDNIDHTNEFLLLFRSSATCFIYILYCYFCLNDLNDVCTRKYVEIVRLIFEHAVVVWWPSCLTRNRLSVASVNFHFMSFTRLDRPIVTARLLAPNIFVVFLSIPLISFRRIDAHSQFIYVAFSFYLKYLFIVLKPPNFYICIPCSFITILVHYTEHSKCRSSKTTLPTFHFICFVIIYVIRLFCVVLIWLLHLKFLIIFIFVVIF